MKKSTLGALLAAPVIVAPSLIGVAHFPAAANHQILDFGLTAEALVMIPAMNQNWLDLGKELYLEPNGFPADGLTTFLQVPQTTDLNASIRGATDILVNTITDKWHDGDFSADDPLYIFGYSQSNVAAGLAQAELAERGIPTDALHFVMVGDSAAAGGFLSGFMPTLLSWIPEAWHDDVTAMVYEFAKMMRIDSVLCPTDECTGLVTPDELYRTDVYTLSSDGWSNWANGTNTGGMFSDHLAYLGLTVDEVEGAKLEPDISTDLTHYYEIDAGDVNMFQALLNSAEMIMGGIIAWF